MDFIPSSIFRGQLSSVSNIPQKSVKLLTSPRFPKKKNETKSMSQELEWRRAAKDFSCQEFTFIKTERWPRRELIKASQKTMLWLVLYMKKRHPRCFISYWFYFDPFVDCLKYYFFLYFLSLLWLNFSAPSFYISWLSQGNTTTFFINEEWKTDIWKVSQVHEEKIMRTG